jgi:hypothetical protein
MMKAGIKKRAIATRAHRENAVQIQRAIGRSIVGIPSCPVDDDEDALID